MRAHRWFFFLLGAFLLILPYEAEAASCTAGVNCYCDRVQNPADPLFDPLHRVGAPEQDRIAEMTGRAGAS